MKTTLLHTLRQAFQLARLTHQHPEKSTDDLLVEHHRHTLDRRQFLRTTARAGLLLGAGGPAIASDLLGAALDKPNYKIAIVGAGMAGLAAGFVLRRKGVIATLFEGDKRPGGRIKSARIFDNGNLNTEIGAEFIDTVHADMLWFARVAGFDGQLMDVEKDLFGERDAFYFENRLFTTKDVLAEFSAVYPQIQRDQKKANRKQAAFFDQMSMADYIDKLQVSPWVKKMLHAAFLGENGLEPAEQSAANLLSIFEIKNEKFYPFGHSDERFKVIGGNEQIPKAIAGQLDGQIRYEHRLVALRENANSSITLVFNVNGATREETFDVVIMTLPFSVLRDIDIKMELPPLKQRVIRELGYGTNAKFILETRDRPWRNRGYRGYLFNEQIPNGWDSAQMQNNNAGAGSFTCYFGGQHGKSAVRGTEQTQLEFILPGLDGAFPGAKASLTGKMELAAWPSNPFVRGSYSCPKPGQVTEFDGAAFEPVRRLYFAGEHTSTEYWGFMNGAAETGRRVAEKMLKKMRVR
ncbi:MAG: FAD-dependent oxidoreductase [Thermoanaerobaculia bacterium]|nr:FAD-dependent oxidoreductase [Thermoanaerobaculia bacterium]